MGTTSQKTEKDIPVFQQNVPVRIGYTYYQVYRSWWSYKLSDNQFLDRKPNAKYLFVHLSVINKDSKARTIPPFHLIDNYGYEYDTYAGAWALPGSMGLIENLNPNVEKSGFIVFDVPPGNEYSLKASGGYWSSENALIKLSPEDR